jgi:multidrug efflux pump subunit AcrA (membrane-fusion protein)
VRVTDFVATHTGKTLRSAQDYASLPFLFATKRLRASRRAFLGNKRRKTLFRLSVWGGIAGAILFCPWVDHIEGDCVLMPVKHSTVVNEVPGHVQKVLVREGTMLKAGDVIAELEKRKIETELTAQREDIRAKEAESERLRGALDEAGAQILALQVASLREILKSREADLEACTLRSPIDGIVLTKDIEKRAGEYLQSGTAVAEIASPEGWDLKIDIDQRDIGRLEKRMEKGTIDASYILYSHTANTLPARIESLRQISSVAEPRQDKHVFVLTVEGVTVPEGMRTSMRPGLTGRAKVDLGWRPLGWLWARALWKWFQIRGWEWLPV